MERALISTETKPLFLIQNLEQIVCQINKDLSINASLEANDFLSGFCQRKFSILDNERSFCLILNHRAEIIYLNQYACEILGVDQKYIFGSCWMTHFVLPEQRTELLLVFEQMLHGFGEHFADYYYEIQTNDSSVLPIQWRNSILRNSNNDITGIFCIGIDQRS